MYTSNYRSSMLSLVVIILLHTQTSFSQSEEWTMFFTREKKVRRPISQHNKRKQKILLCLNLLASWLKNLTLCNSAHFEPTTSFRSSVIFYKLHPTKVNSVNFKLVCTWRHGGHVGGQEQKHFSPLGTKRYFHVNSSGKNSIVLTADPQHEN